MPKKRFYSGVIDPVTIIGVLFLIITAGVGIYVVRNRNINLDINERASCSNTCLQSDFPELCGCTSDNIDDAPAGSGGISVQDEIDEYEEEQQQQNNPPAIQPTTPPTIGCNANGTSYQNGSVVVGGSSSSGYSRCEGNAWVPCPTCTITQLTTVPAYLQEQYNQAVQNILVEQEIAEQTAPRPNDLAIQLSDNQQVQKDICLSDGGMWNSQSMNCTYTTPQQLNEQVQTIQNSRPKGEARCSGSMAEVWNGTTWNSQYCANGCINGSCITATRESIEVNRDDSGTTRNLTTFIYSDEQIVAANIYSLSMYNNVEKVDDGFIRNFTTVLRDKNTNNIFSALTQSVNTWEYNPATNSKPNYEILGYESLEECKNDWKMKLQSTLSCEGYEVSETRNANDAPLYNNFATCNKEDMTEQEIENCNYQLSVAYNIPIANRYFQAYDPKNINYTWQQSGYQSYNQCILHSQKPLQECYDPTQEQLSSSVALGSAMTAGGAIITATGGAATGALTLTQTIALGMAASTALQTGNAVDICIINPGSPECKNSAFWAAVSWLNIGTSTFGSDAVNAVVNIANVGFDIKDIQQSCGTGQYASDFGCGAAIAGIVFDVGQGAVDIASGINRSLSGLDGSMGSLPDNMYVTPDIRNTAAFQIAESLEAQAIRLNQQSVIPQASNISLPPLPAGLAQQLEIDFQGNTIVFPSNTEPQPDPMVEIIKRVTTGQDPDSAMLTIPSPNRPISQATDNDRPIRVAEQILGPTAPQSRDFVVNLDETGNLRQLDYGLIIDPKAPTSIKKVEGSITVKDNNLTVELQNTSDAVIIVDGQKIEPNGTFEISANRPVKLTENTSLVWDGENFQITLIKKPNILTRLLGGTRITPLYGLSKESPSLFSPGDRVVYQTVVKGIEPLKPRLIPPKELFGSQIVYRIELGNGNGIILPLDDINPLPTGKRYTVTFGKIFKEADGSEKFIPLENMVTRIEDKNVRATDLGYATSLSVGTTNTGTYLEHKYPSLYQSTAATISNSLNLPENRLANWWEGLKQSDNRIVKFLTNPEERGSVKVTVTPSTTPLTTRFKNWWDEMFGSIGGFGSPAVDPVADSNNFDDLIKQAEDSISPEYDEAMTHYRDNSPYQPGSASFQPTTEIEKEAFRLIKGDDNIRPQTIGEIIEDNKLRLPVVEEIIQSNSFEEARQILQRYGVEIEISTRAELGGANAQTITPEFILIADDLVSDWPTAKGMIAHESTHTVLSKIKQERLDQLRSIGDHKKAYEVGEANAKVSEEDWAFANGIRADLYELQNNKNLTPDQIATIQQHIKHSIENYNWVVFGDVLPNRNTLSPDIQLVSGKDITKKTSIPTLAKIFENPIRTDRPNAPEEIVNKVLELRIDKTADPDTYTPIATFEISRPSDINDAANLNNLAKTALIERARLEGLNIGVWDGPLKADQTKITRSIIPDTRWQRIIKFLKGQPATNATPDLIYRIKLDQDSVSAGGPTVTTVVDIVNPAQLNIKYSDEIIKAGDNPWRDFLDELGIGGGGSPAGDPVAPNAKYFEEYVGDIIPVDGIDTLSRQQLENYIFDAIKVRSKNTLVSDSDEIQKLINSTKGPIYEIGGPSFQGFKQLDVTQLDKKIIVTNHISPQPVFDSRPEIGLIGHIGKVDMVLDAQSLNLDDKSVGSLIGKSLPKSIIPDFSKEAYRVLESGGILVLDNMSIKDIKSFEDAGFKAVSISNNLDGSVNITLQKPKTLFFPSPSEGWGGVKNWLDERFGGIGGFGSPAGEPDANTPKLLKTNDNKTTTPLAKRVLKTTLIGASGVVGVAGIVVATPNLDRIENYILDKIHYGYFAPTLNTWVYYKNGNWYREDNNELIPKDFEFIYLSNPTNIAENGLKDTFLSQHITIDTNTFNSPEWIEIETAIQKSTIEKGDTYNIHTITNTVHNQFQSHNNDRDTIWGLIAYLYFGKDLEDRIKRDNAVCFEFATAEQAYLARIGIRAEMVSALLNNGSNSAGHIFLKVVDSSGQSWAVDPAMNIVIPYGEYIEANNVTNISIHDYPYEIVNFDANPNFDK